MTTYWCEHAILDGRTEASVRVAVSGGRFASIESGVGSQPTDEILPGVVFPGFANTHSHAFHRTLRGRTQSGPGSFWSWRDQMYQAASRLDPESYNRLACATFGEMIRAGVTSVGEFHYVHHRPDGSPYADPNAMGEALVEAAAAAGIRITLLDTLYLHGGLSDDGYGPLDDTQRRFSDNRADAWVDRVDQLSLGGHARLGAAIHSVRAVAPAAIATVADWSGRHGAPLHVHVSEQLVENDQCLAAHGITPVALLADHGALGRSTTLIHGTHLTPADAEAIGSAGSTVCFCPTTERDLADGIGPAAKLASIGVPLALGSDSHAVIDPFEEARALEMDQRLGFGSRGAFTAAGLLTASTVAGHRALGWDDAGRIEVGQRADLVAVCRESIRTAGVPAGPELVFAATAADVTTVVVDGETVVSEGEHCRFDVAAELNASIEEIMAR